MTMPMRIENIIPKGWVFYSADFSAQTYNLACKGRVTLRRDGDGADKWYSLPPEAKNEVTLFVNGEGPSLWDATNDACRQITKEDDIDAILESYNDPVYRIGDIFEIGDDVEDKYILAFVDNERSTECSTLSLISLKEGNRWCNPIRFNDDNNIMANGIKHSEFKALFNRATISASKFKKVLDAGKIV